MSTRAILAAMCFVAGLVLAVTPAQSTAMLAVAVALIFFALLSLPMPDEGLDDEEDDT